MKWLMFVLAAFLGIVVFAVVSTFRKRRAEAEANDDEPWPFYSKKPLSPPEQVLYHRLVASLPDHIVLAQVQLSRVMGVKKGFNTRGWMNRINRMSFDFVVCVGLIAVMRAPLTASVDRPLCAASPTFGTRRLDRCSQTAALRCRHRALSTRDGLPRMPTRSR